MTEASASGIAAATKDLIPIRRTFLMVVSGAMPVDDGALLTKSYLTNLCRAETP